MWVSAECDGDEEDGDGDGDDAEVRELVDMWHGQSCVFCSYPMPCRRRYVGIVDVKG